MQCKYLFIVREILLFLINSDRCLLSSWSPTTTTLHLGEGSEGLRHDQNVRGRLELGEEQLSLLAAGLVEQDQVDGVEEQVLVPVGVHQDLHLVLLNNRRSQVDSLLLLGTKDGSTCVSERLRGSLGGDAGDDN